MRMPFLFAGLVLAAALPVAAKGEPERTFLPPQLAKLYLEKCYRGKSKSFLYSKMSDAYRRQTPYKEFKKWIADRNIARLGTRIPIKLLRQEILSNDAGVLYYVVQVNQPPLSFKKDFYVLERFRMVREGGEWRLKELPARMMVGDMKERCTKNDFMIVYAMAERDRAAEVLAQSREQAIANSLGVASRLAGQKEFRGALVEYQKVLQLRQDHPEALAGSAFCKESLARNEDVD